MKAAKVSVPPQPDVVSSTPDKESTEGEVAAAACGSSSDVFDPMEEFSRRLEDIISAHGSAATLVDKQVGQQTPALLRLTNCVVDLWGKYVQTKFCIVSGWARVQRRQKWKR